MIAGTVTLEDVVLTWTTEAPWGAEVIRKPDGAFRVL